MSLSFRNQKRIRAHSFFSLENYQFYTAEDFIQDSLFREWVLAGTPESEALWQDFQSRFPERKPVLTAARALLIALHESQSFPTEEQGHRIWNTINNETKRPSETEEAEFSPIVIPLWKWLSAAAVVLVALGLTWLTLWNRSDEPLTYSEQIAESVVPMVEKFNTTNQPLKLTLSDGSRITLYPGSRISYSSPFQGDKREVFLSGKGYFNVTKDDSKPFIVYANQLVTKVVGTSFIIDAFEGNSSPRVEVRSGKVKVFRLDKFRDAEKGKPEVMILLTANQQVKYNITQKDFATSYISKPLLLKTPKAHPDFDFENVAVPDVFQTLEESYGVTIEFDQETLKGCRITAPLGTEPLFRKLDIICQTIGATYEVYGTRIVIAGKGCGF